MKSLLALLLLAASCKCGPQPAAMPTFPSPPVPFQRAMPPLLHLSPPQPAGFAPPAPGTQG